MKRYTIILIFLFLGAIIAGLYSCTKKRTPDTTAGRIVGRWKKIQFATDDNENGAIDASEISNQPAAIDDELLFNSDNTGNETTILNKNKTGESVLDFDWSVVNSSLTIAYRAHDTTAYTVLNVNSGNLILTAETTMGLVWYSYAKQ